MDFILEKTKVSQNGPLKILLAIKDVNGNFKTSSDFTGIKLTVKERNEYNPDVYDDMSGLTNIAIPVSAILDQPETYEGSQYNFEWESSPELPEMFPKRKWSYIVHLAFAIAGRHASVWECELLTN